MSLKKNQKMGKRILSIINLLVLINLISCKDVGKTSESQENLNLSKGYYSNGTLKYCNLKNADSLIDGISYSFYENGQKMTETHFESGLKEGKMFYYVDLSLASVENFKRDTLEGLAKYYLDGLITEEGNYERGQKDGIWNYYENGELILSEYYSNGEIEAVLFDNRN